MLKRITKTLGQFSDAFVEQFKIFFTELKDFFNAGSLTEQLEGLRSSLDGQQISVLDNFLSSKQSLDSLGSSNGNVAKGTDSLIGTMHALTSLRAVLHQRNANTGWGGEGTGEGKATWGHDKFDGSMKDAGRRISMVSTKGRDNDIPERKDLGREPTRSRDTGNSRRKDFGREDRHARFW